MDAHRSVAVHLGTSDLKSMIKTSPGVGGLGGKPGGGPQQVNPDLGPGDPNDVMYLKQVRIINIIFYSARSTASH